MNPSLPLSPFSIFQAHRSPAPERAERKTNGARTFRGRRVSPQTPSLEKGVGFKVRRAKIVPRALRFPTKSTRANERINTRKDMLDLISSHERLSSFGGFSRLRPLAVCTKEVSTKCLTLDYKLRRPLFNRAPGAAREKVTSARRTLYIQRCKSYLIQSVIFNGGP